MKNNSFHIEAEMYSKKVHVIFLIFTFSTLKIVNTQENNVTSSIGTFKKKLTNTIEILQSPVTKALCDLTTVK